MSDNFPDNRPDSFSAKSSGSSAVSSETPSKATPDSTPGPTITITKQARHVDDDFEPDLHPLQNPVNSLNDVLNRQMVSVPGFNTPSVREDNLCPLPSACSQEDLNRFRSAGVLLEALAAEARAWSEKLPPDFRPAIVAVLNGGLQIDVRTLAQVSFDGIRIEGLMGGNPCSLLAHQGTVQLICYAVNVAEEDVLEHHPIGFIWPDHDEVVG